MSKKFHCSICGAELVIIRKAVPGKGAIFNLIEPHECEGQAISECPDGGETILEVLERLSSVGSPVKADKDNPQDGPITKLFIKDSRDDQITSTAPQGILSNLEQDMS